MLDLNSVRVYNYTRSALALSTREKSILLRPCEGGIPTFDFYTMKELEYINSISPVIRLGMVEFEEDVREEVYQILRIPNWRDVCLFERDIDDIILKPTEEKLQRIIQATDEMTIERFRGHLDYLLRRGVDVSTRAKALIEGRYEELLRGIRRSRLEAKQFVPVDTSSEVKSLRAELEAMKEMMKQMAAGNATPPAQPVEEALDTKVVATETVTATEAKAILEAQPAKVTQKNAVPAKRNTRKTAEKK